MEIATISSSSATATVSAATLHNENDIDVVKAHLVRSEERRARLKAGLGKLRDKMRDTNELIELFRATQYERDAVKKRLNETTATLARQMQRGVDADKEIECLRADVAMAAKREEEYRANANSMKSSAANIAELEAMKASVKENKAKFIEKEREIGVLANKVESEKKLSLQLSAAMSKQQECITHQEESIEKLRVENRLLRSSKKVASNLKEKLDELKTSVKAKATELLQQTKKNETLRTTLKTAEERLVASENACSDAQVALKVETKRAIAAESSCIEAKDGLIVAEKARDKALLQLREESKRVSSLTEQLKTNQKACSVCLSRQNAVVGKTVTAPTERIPLTPPIESTMSNTSSRITTKHTYTKSLDVPEVRRRERTISTSSCTSNESSLTFPPRHFLEIGLPISPLIMSSAIHDDEIMSDIEDLMDNSAGDCSNDDNAQSNSEAEKMRLSEMINIPISMPITPLKRRLRMYSSTDEDDDESRSTKRQCKGALLTTASKVAVDVDNSPKPSASSMRPPSVKAAKGPSLSNAKQSPLFKAPLLPKPAVNCSTADVKFMQESSRSPLLARSHPTQPSKNSTIDLKLVEDASTKLSERVRQVAGKTAILQLTLSNAVTSISNEIREFGIYLSTVGCLLAVKKSYIIRSLACGIADAVLDISRVKDTCERLFILIRDVACKKVSNIELHVLCRHVAAELVARTLLLSHSIGNSADTVTAALAAASAKSCRLCGDLITAREAIRALRLNLYYSRPDIFASFCTAWPAVFNEPYESNDRWTMRSLQVSLQVSRYVMLEDISMDAINREKAEVEFRQLFDVNCWTHKDENVDEDREEDVLAHELLDLLFNGLQCSWHEYSLNEETTDVARAVELLASTQDIITWTYPVLIKPLWDWCNRHQGQKADGRLQTIIYVLATLGAIIMEGAERESSCDSNVTSLKVAATNFHQRFIGFIEGQANDKKITSSVVNMATSLLNRRIPL